jgi:hypothetical protein
VSAPFIFITRHRIRDDKVEEFESFGRTFLEFVEQNQSQPIGFHLYATAEGAEATLVQVHPNAESMDNHLRVSGELIKSVFDYAETASIEVYGTPGPAARMLLEQNRAQGVPVVIQEIALGGFARAVAA